MNEETRLRLAGMARRLREARGKRSAARPDDRRLPVCRGAGQKYTAGDTDKCKKNRLRSMRPDPRLCRFLLPIL